MKTNLQLSRKPTGKISQLPPDLIEYVNCAIHDGVKYETIAKYLAEKGFRGFNKWNLSRWRRSGHTQWLLAQDRRDTMLIQSEAALDVARNLTDVDQEKITEFNQTLVATQLAETLWALQANKSDLEQHPDAFVKVANLTSRTARDLLNQKKLALKAEKLRHTLESRARPTSKYS